jgi:lipoprotein-releasing system permease protein
MNVVIIIILMLCVSSFNIISGLIIMILDSVQRIGILKSLGATNQFIRDIFLSQGMMLIFKGVLWGNVIGLLLCLLQYVTHFIPLDPISYYVSYVPIAFPVGWILGINVITLVLSWVIMLAPASVVANISPSKVIHFE